MQKVLYEFIPEYCTKCYRQGHSMAKCRLGVVPAVVPAAAPVIKKKEGDGEGKKEGGEYFHHEGEGEFRRARKKRRRIKNKNKQNVLNPDEGVGEKGKEKVVEEVEAHDAGVELGAMQGGVKETHAQADLPTQATTSQQVPQQKKITHLPPPMESPVISPVSLPISSPIVEGGGADTEEDDEDRSSDSTDEEEDEEKDSGSGEDYGSGEDTDAQIAEEVQQKVDHLGLDTSSSTSTSALHSRRSARLAQKRSKASKPVTSSRVVIGDVPWCVMGDFNCALNASEKKGGGLMGLG